MGEAHPRRVHVYVTGRVQGVWYRASTQTEAERLGLAGWVRNLPDGRVEFVAEGEAEEVDRLLRWARRGPPHAWVERLEVADEVPSGHGGGFRIRR